MLPHQWSLLLWQYVCQNSTMLSHCGMPGVWYLSCLYSLKQMNITKTENAKAHSLTEKYNNSLCIGWQRQKLHIEILKNLACRTNIQNRVQNVMHAEQIKISTSESCIKCRIQQIFHVEQKPCIQAKPRNLDAVLFCFYILILQWRYKCPYCSA